MRKSGRHPTSSLNAGNGAGLEPGTATESNNERAVEDHRSIEAYIRDGLGITDVEIDLLRSELLE